MRRHCSAQVWVPDWVPLSVETIASCERGWYQGLSPEHAFQVCMRKVENG